MKNAQALCERGSFCYLKVSAWGSYWNALQAQRLENTNFVLSLCLAPSGRHHLCTSPVLSSREPVSPGREVLQVSGDKFFCSCHPKDDLYLAWLCWQAWLVNLDPMGQNLGQIPPLGYCADTRLKHTPSLSVNRPISLSWSFNLRDELQVQNITSGLMNCFQGMENGQCHFSNLPLPQSSSLVFPQKGGIFNGHPKYFCCCLWTPLGHLALLASGACVPASHGTVINRERVLGWLPSPGH